MDSLRKMFGGRSQGSRHVAKERLKLVLVHDRTNISPKLLEVLKDEIIGVISRHVEIDREHVQISLTQDDRTHRLTADIPLLPRQEKSR